MSRAAPKPKPPANTTPPPAADKVEAAPAPTEPADVKAEDNADPEPSQPRTDRMTVRLTEQEREDLEGVAREYRRQTGSKETAASLARTFILDGTNRFKRSGGLQIG